MYADTTYYHAYIDGNPSESILPVEKYEIYGARASLYMDEATSFRITKVTDNIKKCCVELALRMYKLEQDGGVLLSQSMGTVSYTYANPESRDSMLNTICKTWLPSKLLYRGMGKC